MKKTGIYQIVNEANGKFYVGSSKDIKNRWRQWKNSFKKEMKYKSPLQMAIRKYGLENFTFIIIEECEQTKETLEERENYYIETLKPEYNILQKAYSPFGFKHSKEAKEKISQANIGKEMSDDTKEKIRTANVGKKLSNTTKQKLKETWAKTKTNRCNKQRKPLSDEAKAHLRLINTGKKLSDDTKQKIREKMMGNNHNPLGRNGL